MWGCMLQPTTWRLNRSITQARYSQPWSVAMQVMSLLHTRSGSLRREVPGQQVLGHWKAVFAVGGDDKLSLVSGLDAMRLHEPLNAVFAHPDASREQLFAYPWPAVFAFDLGVDGSDMRQQRLVAVAPAGHAGPVLRAPALVLEVAADTDVQNLADQRDRPHRPEQKNPGVLHSDSLAQYAVAS